MEKTWEFFEKLDEMVYVSDVDTYELIYMNKHLRDVLGYQGHEDYAGKKCYQVLQGGQEPCAFCTNAKLKVGEFVSWIHNNPVLKRRFLVKDSLVRRDGKNYRVEVAIDATLHENTRDQYYYAGSEAILNECLQRSLSGTNPEESIQNVLSYIGEVFSCDRTYVFEIYPNHTTSSTYEWYSPQAESKKEILQNLPASITDWCTQELEKNKVTVVEDVEDVRQGEPELYALLKSLGISAMAMGVIEVENQIMGFVGVDNPEKRMIALLKPLLSVIGYFISTLLKRRDLLDRLHEISYHDQLTGALNRHALAELYTTNPSMESVGVVYCDVTGLKQMNDTMGHEAGDQLIRSCYELIYGLVGSGMVYRVGGDEFIALCPNCDREHFYDNVFNLQGVIRQDGYRIAVGYVWSDQQPLNLEKLILQADEMMYQDKRDYYVEAGMGVEETDTSENEDEENQESGANPFRNFIRSAHYDVEDMFRAMAQDNASSYFFLGDIQKDLFYISTNMRDDFGFKSNLVHGLPKRWLKRISMPEFQDLYWKDFTTMVQEKRTIQDLRYRVKDVNGNNQWVRSYGVMTWNKDKTVPLFFSCRITHQDNTFVVDPISNFLREHAALQQLAELKKTGEKTLIIGVRLNGITEVNSTKGRAVGDRLLKRCAESLLEHISWKMSFYRLEGMRCMAIVNPVFRTEGEESLICQINDCVKECYKSMGITVENPCSFALMEYPYGQFTPEDLIENLVSLIRVAKQERGLEYVNYSDESIQQVRRLSNMTLALSRDVANRMSNFRIVIQPVVSAGSGRPVGGEVLLRWRFEGKDVSPGLFIPILEKGDMIHTVGRWVFEQAVAACTRLHAYDPSFYLTFNVSLQQLTDQTLTDFMRETLNKYHLKGSSLVAELTESCLDEQPERLVYFLEECQDMGLYSALDDFGSGYSSLRMLLQYPSSIIKLDRSLVLEITESEAKMNFIRSIVYACHQFGKTVCMEGVEWEDQNQIALSTGCDLIQGYYYYRPMELGDVYRLISEENKQ